MSTRPLMRRLGLGVLALGAVLVVLLLRAPATWLDTAIGLASHSRVRLAEARGTIWQGEGRLVFSGVDTEPQALVLPGLALPGLVRWELRPLPLLLGMLDARVGLGVGAEAVHLQGNNTEIRVAAGRVDLPSVDLSRLGSPWNTIRPSSSLSLQWDALTLRPAGLDGKLRIELRDVASAMTPVRPLGTYLIEVAGSAQGIALALSTLSGPLTLSGSGQWTAQRGLQFGAEARSSGTERERLQALLALIGRREGDLTVIRIGG